MLSCSRPGRRSIPERDFKEHVWPYDLPHRGAGVGGTRAPGSGGRIPRAQRRVGNRRRALRFGSRDPTSAGSVRASSAAAPITGDASRYASLRSISKSARVTAWATTGRISYEDVAPYYDKVESYIGVFGTKENIPSAPDGIFLPPPKPRCTETIIKKACDKMNMLCVPSSLAILTKPLNGRAACHYCGQCGRGCVTASNFSSSQVMIPPAEKTGRFTLITGAMARELIVNKDGKVEAVSYIDKATREEKRIHARAFIVAASACESARLLLNSRSTLFPDGLANSSGVVGRNLMDTVGSDGGGYFPHAGKNAAPQPRRRWRHAHVFAVVEVRPQERISARLPHRVRRWTRHARRRRLGRPVRRIRRLRHYAETGVQEEIRDIHRIRRPRRDDSQRKQLLRNRSCDGRPVGHSGASFSLEVERQRNQDGERYAGNLSRDRGIRRVATYIPTQFPTETNPYGIADGGVIIHEMGTVRMGEHPTTSALNQYCQAHDVKNLFVTDGASFVTNADKNPTLTIMALSWRASDYLLDQAKKGNL